ncbi:phosphocholine-specific phospholipase C [Novosphingobium album (ex Hu et al. 2023)]|uniref:phospholipase C n=1 Tax=Novosphingobium album (ex Hu et al. 2023) TaxID=2930093 RepID=A0ABT0B1Z1_9SPHN|nr:phospholipase C, phosphocholine-specific [Novosphingobium album (ex Hu et al. 2023)]MCJ2178936.1 phospholipase C, phosphocholine-specific [Novosphingobium album (ex Hu et al. 2023)]
MVLPHDRRSFIRNMIASGGAAAGFMPSIARALEIPADRRTGTIQDVEHVVILTQENRAFDHYFGTMRGVQGYGDRFAIPAPPLADAPRRTVLVQPNEKEGESPALIAPFRLDTQADFRLYRPLGTPHGFPDSQAAWDNGRMGEWPRHKHNHAMAHFSREDLPFQYALAEAFTLCDAYHCALHLSTNPNRLYIWTGTHDPQAKAGGPAIDNGYDDMGADPRGNGGYTWTTYPERLMAAGIGFQVYEDMADNFGDNPLVGFQRYRAADKASDGPLADLASRSIRTRDLDKLKEDVEQKRLPAVSWVVGPTRFSEHPSVSTPLEGAEYIARVLDALTANPEVWARTVLLINFDENDGLFDHAPSPAPPARSRGATTVPADDEYHTHPQDEADAQYLGRPYGLGPRVPMYVVSPWSKGGHVASEVFDHTSVIRFLETRFGVREPNISAWRRAVCGDLTSCFDFSKTDADEFMAALPPTRALSDRAAGLKNIAPPLPSGIVAPVQETGVKPRRATPYRLDVWLGGDAGAPSLVFANAGEERAAVFHLYDVNDLGADPARYTVGARQRLTGAVPAAPEGRQTDLFIVGPNRFHRRLRGRADRFSARIEVSHAGKAELVLVNITREPLPVALADMAYGQTYAAVALKAGATVRQPLDLSANHGWYDLGLAASGQSWRMAGHVENGKGSFSDPAAGGAGPLTLA